MPIRVTCHRCHADAKAPDRLAGEEMECPSCGATLAVPSAGVRDRPGDRAPARARYEPPTRDGHDAPERRLRSRGGPPTRRAHR